MHAPRLIAYIAVLTALSRFANAQVAVVSVGVSPSAAGEGAVGQAAATVISVVSTGATTPTVPVTPPDVRPTPPFTNTVPSLTPGAGVSPTRVLKIIDTAWSGSTNTIDTSTLRSTSFPARLTNVSVRGLVALGNSVIGGGSITGSSTLPVYVRTTGPTLRSFGVTGPLQFPMMEVYEDGTLAAATDFAQSALAPVANYVGTFAATAVTADSESPSDAVLVGRPIPGNLTAICSSNYQAAGVALIEFFDASSAPSASSPRFHNFSGRARIETNDGVLIVGFVIAGNGQMTVLLRGIGSSLTQFGVSDTISDPVIELHDVTGAIIASNDNWQAGSASPAALLEAGTKVGAFKLTDANESALLVTLPAGVYSLQLRDAQNRSGNGLAEIYEVPAGS